MSDFAVVAELPLGAYRARTPEEGLDLVPSPTRLHAALLCAAAAGPRAVADGDLLRPSDEDAAALRWLEHHPPDGVALPPLRTVLTPAIAYRREGTLVKEGEDKGPKDKVLGKSLVGLVAVGGPFAWTWRSAPPEEVRASLEELCPDVSHLGTSETPARLRVGTAVPTHRRDPDADLFSAAGIDMDVAGPGRTDALVARHRADQVRPSAARDRYAPTSDKALSAVYVGEGRLPARYVAPRADEPDAPWGSVLLAEFGHPGDRLHDHERVGWAVAVHRALISLVGDTAPTVLTGSYAEGVTRPPNRVAVQFLLGHAAVTGGGSGDVPLVAVMLPMGASAPELATVAQAFGRLRVVRRHQGRRALGQLPAKSAQAFWPAAEGGGARVWAVDPVAVPDTRPLRGGWTLHDVVALSVGLVLRDRFRVEGRNNMRYRQMAAAALGGGLEVLTAQRVSQGNLTRFVHRVREGTVVQPYLATLRWNGLLDDRALVCIGQSRHLGGGLLIPDRTERSAK